MALPSKERAALFMEARAWISSLCTRPNGHAESASGDGCYSVSPTDRYASTANLSKAWRVDIVRVDTVLEVLEKVT